MAIAEYYKIESINNETEIKIGDIFFNHWGRLPVPKPDYTTWFYGSGLKEAVSFMVRTASKLADTTQKRDAHIFDHLPIL